MDIITAILGYCWVTASRSVVIGADPGKCCRILARNGYSLIFGIPQHRVGPTRPRVVAGPGPVPRTDYGWPSSRQLAGRFATHGHATDGQMGGRAGDEGPETVVLRATCRGTEAARWRVNLKTGHRVLPM
jgi:hypothetical protein